MRWCFDKRVLVAGAAAAVGVLLFAPRYAVVVLPRARSLGVAAADARHAARADWLARRAD